MQCDPAHVQRLNRMMHSTPRYQSALTMLPCDLYSAIQGRTLWVVGDSQQQLFYRQLRCFLGPILEPSPWRRRDVRMTDDPAHLKVGMQRGHVWPSMGACRRAWLGAGGAARCVAG